MPNQEKLLRAWVYARIPGDCAATRASYEPAAGRPVTTAAR